MKLFHQRFVLSSGQIVKALPLLSKTTAHSILLKAILLSPTRVNIWC